MEGIRKIASDMQTPEGQGKVVPYVNAHEYTPFNDDVQRLFPY